MDIKQIVLDLCALSDEQEWFEFKENWFQPEANMYLPCQMRRLFIIKNMRISFGV